MDFDVDVIYNEKCELILDRLPTGCVDYFLQDTPFGITQNPWDIKPHFESMWPRWLRVGKESAPFIFFATMEFAVELINSMPSLFRYDIIWNKIGKSTGFLNTAYQPLRAHELILVFYRKVPTYNPQKYIGKPSHTRGPRYYSGAKQKNNNYGHFRNKEEEEVSSEKHPTSVLNFPVVHPAKHPTEKPVDLLRWFILSYSNPGDIGFDGYSGSGSMMEASIIEGRRYICAESDTENGYYTDSIERERLAKEKWIRQQRIVFP